VPHDLRELAAGQPCVVRIPGECNFDSTTTILAHIRRANVAGMGQKPPDTCAVWACSSCHDIIDGRRQSLFKPEEIDSMILDALVRQLAWYDRNEVLLVCA
jgi:ferredoxin